MKETLALVMAFYEELIIRQDAFQIERSTLSIMPCPL